MTKVNGEGFAYFRWVCLMQGRRAAEYPRFYWRITQGAANWKK